MTRLVSPAVLLCWACSSVSTNQADAVADAGPADVELEADAVADAGPADVELEADAVADAGPADVELEADAVADAGPADVGPDVLPEAGPNWSGCTYFGTAYDPNCNGPTPFYVGCAGGASPAPLGCKYFAPHGSGSAFCCAGHP